MTTTTDRTSTDLDTDSPLTAAQRGPAWIAKYGCTIPDCGLDHAGPDGEPGWHATAPIETQVRDIDSEDPNGLPFLGAQIVVTDWGYNDARQQVDGRFTKVWVHYGVCTGELSPDKARQVAQEMRVYADRLVELCDRADEIAADDFAATAGGDR